MQKFIWLYSAEFIFDWGIRQFLWALHLYSHFHRSLCTLDPEINYSCIITITHLHYCFWFETLCLTDCKVLRDQGTKQVNRSSWFTMGEKKSRLCLRLLEISPFYRFWTFQSAGLLWFFFSEGHASNQVIHVNLLRICFIDSEKWWVSEKNISSEFRFRI